MKYKYIIAAFLLTLLMASCSDWLAVSPRTQMEGEKLFKSESGFKSAHIGIYMLLTSQDLYGRNANMYFPEALARNWALPINLDTSNKVNLETLQEISKFNYKHMRVEPFIEKMWLKHYYAIVQLNNILDNLETTNVKFYYNNDKLIQGEALGLRAFLHLELLRYFGSIPGEGEIGIPYVGEMTKAVDALQSKTFSEVVALIEEDLQKAEVLLEEVDPIVRYSNTSLNKPGFDATDLEEWQTKRQGRFNYYAVLGTKARLYHWLGDKDNAIKYAKMVIEAKNENGTSKFPLTIASTLKDQVFYGEHLFGLHNPKLVVNLETTFGSKDPLLTQSKTNVDKAYDISSHPSDIRYKGGFSWENVEYVNQVYHFRKYSGTTSMASINRIPLLRIAELYFILIENEEFDVAKSIFITFAKERSLIVATIELGLTDESKILPLLEKEYRKEFYGEGQMFFFYKKHNYLKYTWPVSLTLPEGVYIIPKPVGQTQFE